MPGQKHRYLMRKLFSNTPLTTLSNQSFLDVYVSVSIGCTRKTHYILSLSLIYTGYPEIGEGLTHEHNNGKKTITCE